PGVRDRAAVDVAPVRRRRRWWRRLGLAGEGVAGRHGARGDAEREVLLGIDSAGERLGGRGDEGLVDGADGGRRNAHPDDEGGGGSDREESFHSNRAPPRRPSGRIARKRNSARVPAGWR